MTTHTFPITRPVAGPGTGDDRPSRSTPSRLIAAGAVAGPVFVAASFAQLPFQSGFDVTRHAFSFLLLGATGWVEEVTFIVAGALFVAGAVGIRRVLGGRAGAVALLGGAMLGVGKVIAGIWAPQPSFGFPVGAPAGAPEVLTTSSIMHGVGFGVAMLGWTALLVTLAVVSWRRFADRPAALVATGVAVGSLIVPAMSSQPFGTILIYVLVTVGYGVTSWLFVRVARHDMGSRVAVAEECPAIAGGGRR